MVELLKQMCRKLFLEGVWSDCIPHTVRQTVPEFWSNEGEGSVFKLILVLRYWFTQQQLTTTSQVVV